MLPTGADSADVTAATTVTITVATRRRSPAKVTIRHPWERFHEKS